MVYSIFFSAGLGLGFILGSAIWGLSSWLARAKAERVFKEQLIRLKQEGLVKQQQLAEVRQKMLETYGSGPGLTERHKQVMEEELAATLGAMPPMPKGRR